MFNNQEVSAISASIVKAVREKLELTQGQFASLLGVHPITVSRWESGALQPTPYQLGLIQHFGRAAPQRQAANEDLGTLLISIGVIGVMGLLFKWAAEEAQRNTRRRGRL